MNAEHRRIIAAHLDKLQNIQESVESLLNAEQEALENMPESFRNGDRGELAEGVIESLQQAVDSLSETMNSLEEAQG